MGLSGSNFYDNFSNADTIKECHRVTEIQKDRQRQTDKQICYISALRMLVNSW